MAGIRRKATSEVEQAALEDVCVLLSLVSPPSPFGCFVQKDLPQHWLLASINLQLAQTASFSGDADRWCSAVRSELQAIKVEGCLLQVVERPLDVASGTHFGSLKLSAHQQLEEQLANEMGIKLFRIDMPNNWTSEKANQIAVLIDKFAAELCAWCGITSPKATKRSKKSAHLFDRSSKQEEVNKKPLWGPSMQVKPQEHSFRAAKNTLHPAAAAALLRA